MQSERSEFLCEYYRLLTDDIRRSEGMIPKVCALEVAVVVFLGVSQWLHVPRFVPALLVLLTSTWAMHLLINANLWAGRSHLMATNVEKEFFEAGDLDVLLPRRYYEDARRFHYRRAFRAPLALSASLFLIGAAYVPRTWNFSSLGMAVLVAVLVGSVYGENRRCAREYTYLVAHAAGRLPRRGD